MKKRHLGVVNCLIMLFASLSSQAKEQGNPTPILTDSPLQVKVSGEGTFYGICGSQNNWSTHTFKAKQDSPAAPDVKKSTESPLLFGFGDTKFSFEGSSPIFGDNTNTISLKLGVGDTPSGLGIKERYIKFENKEIGSILLGDTVGAEDMMRAGAASTQVGSGGIFGAFWGKFVRLTYGVENSQGLGGSQAGGGTAGSTKLTLQTQKIQGLQVGASFTPHGNHFGNNGLDTSSNGGFGKGAPYQRNALSLATNYKFSPVSCEKVKIAFSAVGAYGALHPETTEGLKAGQSLARNDVLAGALGCDVSYDALTIGYDFTHNGSSGQLKQNSAGPIDPNVGGTSEPKSYLAGNATAAQVHAFGVNYNFGCVKASAGLMLSNRYTGFKDSAGKKGEATSRTIALGVEHEVSKGIAVYAEYANQHMVNPDAFHEAALLAQNAPDGSVEAVGNNDSNCLIFGVKVKF